MVTLYGIPNCDTMKKARAWLAQNGVDYRFHDFKKQGLERRLLLDWVRKVGWETLLNRRGMMWRKLPQAVRDGIDEDRAIEVMLETPSIIKRPVLDIDGQVTIGFKAPEYSRLFEA